MSRFCETTALALAVAEKSPPAFVHVDVPKKLLDQVASPGLAAKPWPVPPPPSPAPVVPSPQFARSECRPIVRGVVSVPATPCKTSVSWTPAVDRGHNEVIKIKFSAKDCGGCPVRDRCTRTGRRSITVRPRDQYEALRAYFVDVYVSLLSAQTKKFVRAGWRLRYGRRQISIGWIYVVAKRRRWKVTIKRTQARKRGHATQANGMRIYGADRWDATSSFLPNLRSQAARQRCVMPFNRENRCPEVIRLAL